MKTKVCLGHKNTFPFEIKVENILSPLFNMIVVGMTDCGKTYYFLEMIAKEYPQHYDYMLLFFGGFLIILGVIFLAQNSIK